MIALVLLPLATMASPSHAFEEQPATRIANLLAETPIERVEVSPDHVDLVGRHAYSQLLLTAHLEGGLRVDVTRSMELESIPACVELDGRGLLRPVHDGEGQLRLKVSGVTVEIPIRVSGQGSDPDPSFVRDVMPRLSRLGCNLGTCHGADKGKNGFKLSLRGYDPSFDHAALTDDLSGRRFDRVDPERSLFLLKPIGEVPHEGGQRLQAGTSDYDLLRDWIASGAGFDRGAPRVTSIRMEPESPTIPVAELSQQFAVIATYSDGSERDVTAHAFFEASDIEVTDVSDSGLVTALRRGESAILARYEGQYAATTMVVMGDRSGFEWREVESFNWIDDLVHEKLQRVKTSSGEVCTDEEFLRRIHLDLTGRPPSPRQTRTFLLDGRDSRLKREEVIDRLIGSAEFVEYWTNKWCDLLQVNPKFLGKEGASRARDWIRASVASNQPYDEFVSQILTATGSTLENPAGAYYRVLREPDLAMENTTQLFLGVRFNCNKCHDHPFERWTQDQHWELAGFFAQIKLEAVQGNRNEERIQDGTAGAVTSPRTNASVTPSFPYTTGAEGPTDAPLRAQLATWLTARENPYFARSYTNRVWSYLLGRGLIEPVDDIRASNPPSNPALLDRLTEQFISTGFDTRDLIRTICRSRTYQLSVASDSWNDDDELNYSHAMARRLPAEVLFDALHAATGSRPRLPGQRIGTSASELADPSVETRDGFLGLFGRPPRESACECERGDGLSLGQALSLVNGPTVAEAISDPQNSLSDLAEVVTSPEQLLEELYLSFLCRFPTAEEIDALAPSLDPRRSENRLALDPQGLEVFDQRFESWLKTNERPAWLPTAVRSARSSGGATLSIGTDGSILVSGENPEQETTTLVIWTEAQKIGGIRIEMLPHPDLPGSGSGRSENGNFVLSEFTAVTVPAEDLSATRSLEFPRATASFSQQGWAIGGSVDGKRETGWAVMPRLSERHEAVFALAEPLETPGGAVLVVTLEQHHGKLHTLGQFRISVTEAQGPAASALPAPVLAALETPRNQRTPEQVETLVAHLLGTDADLRKRIRLAATRDLAWALANSPGFLFNR